MMLFHWSVEDDKVAFLKMAAHTVTSHSEILLRAFSNLQVSSCLSRPASTKS